jgi:transposase
LDRQPVDEIYAGVGKDAYDPMVLLKMVLYQLLLGNHSPATWHKEAARNTTMKWLGRGYQPARSVWYDFRDRTGKFIDKLHQQLIHSAIDQGHLDPSTGALDGSSIAACASRHRMVNSSTLDKRRAILQRLVDGERFDPSEIPRWVPPTDTGRVDLLDRMDRAESVLQQRLQRNQARPSDKRTDPDKVVVSLSDPDAPLGLDKRKTYRPLYTVQKMVDPTSHLTMSYTCKAATGDAGMLTPMIDKTQQIVGGRLKNVLADGGYCSILDVRDSIDRNIDLFAPVSASGTARQNKSRSGLQQIPRERFEFNAEKNHYVCPSGQILQYKDREKKLRGGDRYLYQSRYQGDGATCNACSLAGECLSGKGGRRIKRSDGEELLEAQREKMQTGQAKQLYALRGQSVELVFADDKGNRHHDRFHGRGLERVRAETGLITLARNLFRLDKLQQNASKPEKTAA